MIGLLPDLATGSGLFHNIAETAFCFPVWCLACGQPPDPGTNTDRTQAISPPGLGHFFIRRPRHEEVNGIADPGDFRKTLPFPARTDRSGLPRSPRRDWR